MIDGIWTRPNGERLVSMPSGAGTFILLKPDAARAQAAWLLAAADEAEGGPAVASSTSTRCDSLGPMVAALEHWKRRSGEAFDPTPMPLVTAMQEIAALPVHEDRAPEAMAAIWPADYPRDPALAARRTMADLLIGWLATCGETVQLDAIERIERDITVNVWAVLALNREVAKLSRAALALAADAFRALASNTPPGPLHAVAILGAVGLDRLSDTEALLTLDLVKRGDPTWRCFAVSALMTSANRLARQLVWDEAAEHLLAIVEDPAEDAAQRRRAAMFALQRTGQALKLSEVGRAAVRVRLAAMADKAPFSEHLEVNLRLRRELRRLGLIKS